MCILGMSDGVLKIGDADVLHNPPAVRSQVAGQPAPALTDIQATSRPRDDKVPSSSAPGCQAACGFKTLGLLSDLPPSPPTAHLPDLPARPPSPLETFTAETIRWCFPRPSVPFSKLRVLHGLV